MSAKLTDVQMQRIAKAIASSETMARAARKLGYASSGTLRTIVWRHPELKSMVAAERERLKQT